MLQSALPIEADDSLVFQVYASVASLVVLFSGLHMDARGETKYWEREVRPTSDRLVTTASTVVGKCFLISVGATLRSGNANRGQCYVRAFIRRGSGATGIPVYQLLQGYVSDAYSPCYPLGRMEGPLEGPGMIRSVTGTNPAAGAEISETVPTGARWRFISLSSVLDTDATAVNRRPTLVVTDGTNTFGNYMTATNLTANTIQPVCFAEGIGDAVLANFMSQAASPNNFMLPAGYQLTTDSFNLQAGDEWTAPQLLVEEWLEA